MLKFIRHLERPLCLKSFPRLFRSSLVWAEINIVLTSLLLVSIDFIRGGLISAAFSLKLSHFLILSAVLLLVVLAKCWTFYQYSYHFRRYKVLSLSALRAEIFRSLLGRNFPGFLRHPSGEYYACYQSQVDAVDWQYYESWYGFQQIIFEVLFALISLLIISPRLALLALIILIPGALLPELLSQETKKRSTAYTQAKNDLLAQFKDRLHAFELIDQYGAQNEFARAMETDSRHFERAALKTGSFQWLVISSAQLLTGLGVLAFILMAAWMLSRGELSLRAFVSASGLMSSLQGNSFYVASYLHMFVAVRSPLAAIEKLLAESEALIEKTAASARPSAAAVPAVEFRHVAFAYPDKPERELFRDLSFKTEGAGLTLIRGESGSGKSTAMNLLLAYAQPTRGQILLDGQALNDRDPLLSVSVMRQEASFLIDSLRNNLCLYQEDSDPRQLLRELDLERLARDEALEQALDHNAAALSGGEARRLMLIRCLLAKRPILILDEPLANLDAESMRLVSEQILRASRSQRIFLISHQVSPELQAAADQEIWIHAS